MSEQRTYTILTDDLIPIVELEGAAICGKVATMCGEENTPCELSNEYLVTFLHKSANTIRKVLEKLQLLGYIERTQGNGRGGISKYKKGANLEPFIVSKRVQNLSIKGANFEPIKYKKIYKIDNQRAQARKINQSKVKSSKAGDTPAPPIESMEQFEQFWQAFFSGKYAKYEKEQLSYKDSAAAAWRYTGEKKRERMLREIKAGKRWDKTHWVKWYIDNYEIPLPIWYELDPDLTADMVGGLIYVRYNGRGAYIKPEDKDAWLKKGARMFNN